MHATEEWNLESIRSFSVHSFHLLGVDKLVAYATLGGREKGALACM